MNHTLIKKFLYAKDPYAKNHLLTNKRESTAIKYLNAFKAFIKYSNQIIWMIFIKILKNIIQMKNLFLSENLILLTQ